ncbi:MAG: AAA family ATPase, partial [Burkholderiaceae bacterium]|nr:AAA family ATPase [Burkholderiaceae bacterium]
MTENTMPAGASQARLIGALAQALRRRGREVELFETHISTVLVAPPDAYKFKKPLRFDFLDFSTLEARRFYCEEEVRLNRRLAPQLYLGVAAIGGGARQPVIDQTGEQADAPLEYAVAMRAFSQQALWSERIARRLLGADEIDDLARLLARFHGAAPRAPLESAWGGIDVLRKTGDDNLVLLDALARDDDEKHEIAVLRHWQDARRRALATRFGQRKADGFVRECHGDLHSANILTQGGEVAAFDCIEFNESLRWIDVINDLAFICMDLEFHGLHALAARLRNGYLEEGGDYEGAALLRYYQTELALVRWKINWLRARSQDAGPEAPACEALAARYRAYALQTMRPGRAALVITHGLSGSGKSTLARILVELCGAVRIRSDVERKRLYGAAPDGTGAAPPANELYGAQASAATYARLRALAAQLLQAGLPVIVDATFLQRARRHDFAALADALGVPFFILDIRAGADTLRARLIERARRGNDASDAGVEVLERQLGVDEG